MQNKRYLFFLFPLAVLFFITAVVMWLWNALLPEIVGVKTINYWQAMGILLLGKILFGGFGGGKIRDFRRANCTPGNQNMTAEEKERLKEIWKKRCQNNFFGQNKKNETF